MIVSFHSICFLKQLSFAILYKMCACVEIKEFCKYIHISDLTGFVYIDLFNSLIS